MLLAANILDPIVTLMIGVLNGIHGVVPSYGISLILLALALRLVLWPLSNVQFKSMAEMQKLQPQLKALQAKYKGEPQKLNTEMMALYKEHKVNPFAGCLPLVVQLPILFSLFYAIQSQTDKFKTEGFLWIGTAVSHQFPQIFAVSLADFDVVLFALYVVSMYLSVRYGSPPSPDPSAAQQQKIMSIVSPAMLAFFGYKYHWASALVVYWLALNVFTMGQQFLMYRKYGLIGRKPEPVTIDMPPEPVKAVKNGDVAKRNGSTSNGSTGGRSRRSKR